MSVTAYDGQFSFRQNELATKGIDHDKRGMSAEQYEKFKESPFMKKARMQEEYTWTMTCDRDRKRKERDPAFKPSDSDFAAPKAYEYEKNVNYYKVLGVDDLASLEEIKKAYKKLSLIYHPDKTQGMSREQQDEHQAIFIELKNAYLVLSDQPTRRQYDRDRDYMDAGAEVNGIKKKPDKQSFDATVVLKKLQEMQKPAGQERIVEVYCKLEKFFYGGAKTFKRSRRVIKEGYEYYADKVFRIDLPKGAAENWTCKMRGGDMNWDAQPDTYKFMLKSKEHEIVERRRGSPDLQVKKQVVLKPDAHLQPFLNMEVSTLAGRTILFWGRNPLYSQTGAANATLNVSVQGEALGPTGMLRFMAKIGEGKTVKQGGKAIIVLVRAAYTKIEFYVSIDVDGTVEHLKRAIAEVMEWHEDKEFKVLKLVDDKETSAFYSDKVQLGNTRKVVLESDTRIYEVPMSIRRARELLDSVLVHCDTEQFTEELRQCRKQRGTAAGEQRVRDLWDPVVYLGPACGYNSRLESLRMAVNRAIWVLRGEPDALVLQERYAQFGFWLHEPPKPKIPKRRRLPRPPVEQFLIRNALGPAKWFESEANLPDPGSETESEKEEDAAEKPVEIAEDDLLFGMASSSISKQAKKARKCHGAFAAAVHPQMIKRGLRREEIAPTCDLELTPMFGYGETLQLFTKPQCFLHFYSNLKQGWNVQSGHLRPRPMFAIAVCCPTGAKRVGRDNWTRLRTRLLPLLKQAAFLMVGEARNILPRPLKAEPAFSEDAYSTEEGIKVMRPGEDEGELEEDAEDSAEEREIVELARQKAATAGKDGPVVSKAGANKASAPAQTRTVEKTFGDRKPRVLCLHDMAGGNDIFQVQAMRLFEACKDKVELIVLEGPESSKAGEELDNMKEFFPGKSYMQYAEPHLDGRSWRCYKSVRSALSWIQGKIEELDPIDGVLGFSQGADFAAMLAAQSFVGCGTPLSFVCLMNPTAPGYAAELTDLFTGSPLPVPALIIRGEQEAYDDGLKKTLQGRSISTQGEKAPAAHVAKFFEAPEVKVHSEGHRPFPLDKREAEDICKAVVDFIVAKSPEPPVVELEDGELEDGEIDDDEDAGEEAGGGMFDFDDLAEQDEVDAAADEIRQQRRNERRRKGAVQEVWRREGKMQAKRSEFIKALFAKEEATGVPAFPVTPESKADEAARWKRLAGRAFQRGDYFMAQDLYTRELACLREDDTEALSVVHSNRSACFVKVRHFAAALEDAQKAVELRPTWGRAWSRVGTASSSLGGEGALERTRNAWFKAVECDPCAQHVEGLATAWSNHGDKKTEMGHAMKEKGNEALRAGDWGTAVAHFTVGLTTMPPPVKGKDPEEDDDALLRSILYSNRCCALSRAKNWQDAVKDGQLATEFKEDYSKAYCRLGVAQLGCKMNEQAYMSFAKALHFDESCKTARKGREVCLGLLPHWDSPKALRRRARFGKDRYRPLETTKIYVISDVHYDHPANEEWCSSIHATKFLDDVLIISGNVADSFRALTRALTTLRAKFRRVFYVPGNHEMWIPTSEQKKFPDSLCKLLAIMELCDDLDVDIFPASVCKDVFIVPLLSWYNVHFDLKDPFPDPKSQADKYTKWPMDAHGQVWRYMLRLNQENLNAPYHSNVITVSHFLPRHNLPVWRESGVMKTCGCIELDDQVREAKSVCHIYGHTHYRHNQVHDGVAYVHRPLGESSEEGQRDPLMCIFNGKNLCSELVQI